MSADEQPFAAVEILKQISQEVSTCQKCVLHHSRKLAVPGEGPADAQIMFIGEGPGFYENEQGRPFVGAAGQFLDKLLDSIGMNRAEVYITNVVKCRPPGNRDPLPEELSACDLYLERQIQAINPAVIVTLGRYSMARFLPGARISEVHGQARIVNGRTIVAMYHPAAALHQNKLKDVIQADFKRLPSFVSKALINQKQNLKVAEAPAQLFEQTQFDIKPVAEQDANPKKEPKQLSLF